MRGADSEFPYCPKECQRLSCKSMFASIGLDDYARSPAILWDAVLLG